MQLIDIHEEIERFLAFLNDNPRTIFSAKFGDGKTFFLEKARIEGERSGDFHFVTLYPINYSVASTEDIFEYVKRDILLQFHNDGKLYNTNVEAVFDSLFNPESITDIVQFLVSYLPGGEKLNKIIDAFLAYKKKISKRDFGFKRYEALFKSQRGGLYECDAFTTYIQRIIKDIQSEECEKREKAKKVVLIIEDLDRLDPAHLFRLLNVISAHIDQSKDGLVNKFGFNNIVLVMDYDCTQNIFTHFYGDRANFTGFMSKFSSNYIYKYSITELARGQLYNYLYETCHLPKDTVQNMIVHKAASYADKSVYLTSLINDLSVREIASCLDKPEVAIKRDRITYKKDRHYSIQAKTPLTLFIVILMRIDKNATISKQKILDMIVSLGPQAVELCKEYLLSLGFGDINVIAYNNISRMKWFRLNPVKDGGTMTITHIEVTETSLQGTNPKDLPIAIKEAFMEASKSIPDFYARP